MLSERHLECRRAEENDASLLIGQIAPWRVDIEAVRPTDRLHDIQGYLAVDRVSVLQRRHESAVPKTLTRVRDQKAGIDAILDTESCTRFTGAERMIEAEVTAGESRTFRIDGAPCEREPQQVEQTCHGSDRRTSAGGEGTFAERDGGGKPGEFADRGSTELAEVLPRPRRERPEEPVLPLPNEGVEDQRCLSGSGRPHHRDPLAVRQVEIDLLKVVLRRAAEPQDAGHAGDSTRSADDYLQPFG